MDGMLRGLLDKQEITEALHRYARSMDRCDAALGYSVFWPEAKADYGEQMFVGTGHGFVDMCMKAHLEVSYAHSHQMSTISIWLDGDTARSETYGDVTHHSIDPNGQHWDSRSLGRYIDRWERRNDEWRIIDRRFVLDFDSTTPCTSMFATTGLRNREDASYFGEA